PQTEHRGLADLPFVQLGDGVEAQLLQVDLAQGVWTLRTRIQPGVTLPTHRHTGQVYAFTHAGCWYYLHDPEAQNTAGSYLFEPANSVHTLHVPETNTEVTDMSFVIWGANLDLDDDGNVVRVSDAAGIHERYLAACAEQHGLADPPVVVLGLAD
ncbi:MAG: 2,4'-dihydroxyacetophenone dioxygenase family protein, partial [Acidimicrobiales bacterium]